MSRRTVFSLIALFFILSMSCFSGEVIAQNEGERMFRQLPEPVRTVDLDAMQIIYQPASLTMDSNGDMALYDYDLNQLYIIYFADEGHTTAIGDGQGESPGEFLNPIGLDFDEEGYTFFGEGKRIGTVIDVYEVTSGDYLYSYDVEKRANGLAAAGDLLALMQHEDGIYEILVFELN